MSVGDARSRLRAMPREHAALLGGSLLLAAVAAAAWATGGYEQAVVFALGSVLTTLFALVLPS